MAGRQRLQQREERSEPVRALLGIGPGALSPPSSPFPFCYRAAAGALCQSRGVPLPLRHAAANRKKNFAGGSRSHDRSSKASEVPAESHSGHLTQGYSTGPPFQKSALAKRCTRLSPVCRHWGKYPPVPPRTPKHNPCRNTASTRPAQAETMIFCFCFLSLPIPSRQGKAAPRPPSGRAAAGGGERKKPGN